MGVLRVEIENPVIACKEICGEGIETNFEFSRLLKAGEFCGAFDAGGLAVLPEAFVDHIQAAIGIDRIGGFGCD